MRLRGASQFGANRFGADQLKVFLARNGVFVALVVLIAVFTAIRPHFFSVANLETVLSQIAEPGLIALPVAFVTMQGTADLSVGSVASVAAVLSAQTMVSAHNAAVGVIAGLAFGAAAGALNGVLVSYLNLNTLVVTLGFLSVWGGLALLITKGVTVANLPTSFTDIGTATVHGVPYDAILLVLVAIIAWYLLNHNPRGTEILAVGGNQRAAYLMGIKVRRVKLQTFIVSGFMAALAGILLTARLTAAPPTVGSGMELNALTVVLLGGVAFEGGSGRISGVIAGLLFVGVLKDGLIILNVSAYLQTVLVGVTLIVAIAVDNSLRSLILSVWRSRGRRLLGEAAGPAAQATAPAETSAADQ